MNGWLGAPASLPRGEVAGGSWRACAPGVCCAAIRGLRCERVSGSVTEGLAGGRLQQAGEKRAGGRAAEVQQLEKGSRAASTRCVTCAATARPQAHTPGTKPSTAPGAPELLPAITRQRAACQFLSWCCKHASIVTACGDSPALLGGAIAHDAGHLAPVHQLIAARGWLQAGLNQLQQVLHLCTNIQGSGLAHIIAQQQHPGSGTRLPQTMEC